MPSQKSSFLVDLGNFRETEKQIHTHTNAQNARKPSAHSIWELAVPLLIPSVAQWGYETWNGGPHSFFKYNSLK